MFDTVAAPVGAFEGTADRLDVLYRDHVPGALRLAYLLTGDHALAEDLVHDAFIRVGGRLRVLRDPQAFRAYFHRAVVNATRSHFRRSNVANRYLIREAARAVTNMYWQPPDAETRELLWHALQELPERQREALVLRFYLDLSERDTAEILQCPVGTVKSSVSRALDALRTALAEEGRA